MGRRQRRNVQPSPKTVITARGPRSGGGRGEAVAEADMRSVWASTGESATDVDRDSFNDDGSSPVTHVASQKPVHDQWRHLPN